MLRDDIIELTEYYTKRKYPEKLRIVGYIDPKTEKHYEFMTNNMKPAAITIAGIYKSRWDIETFFSLINSLATD